MSNEGRGYLHRHEPGGLAALIPLFDGVGGDSPIAPTPPGIFVLFDGLGAKLVHGVDEVIRKGIQCPLSLLRGRVDDLATLEAEPDAGNLAARIGGGEVKADLAIG